MTQFENIKVLRIKSYEIMHSIIESLVNYSNSL
jgi:hypothetical protein